MLGYVGYRPDVSDKKLINLKVGISGIEKLYNKKLLGSHGWRKIETNSSGRIMKTLKQEFSKPGKNIQTDDEIDAFVRGAVESAYHPCGTCKMGSDNMSVVDGNCRLIGFDGLTIADSSIIPSIVSGNLNAPTIMIAEKAADLLCGKESLQPESPTLFRTKNYDSSQR